MTERNSKSVNAASHDLPDDREPLRAHTGAKSALSEIECLYASKDEKLVLFETKEGHLVAVGASKLV